jgi:ABC-type enterochelin transport system substrate-binding protein
MPRRTLLASALLFAAVAVPASAQDMRLRATVEKVDGSTYIVKDRDGVEQKLTTTDQPLYVAIVRVSMADIKPGMFVGSTAMPAADGSLQAVEVHIFPEAMRGTGEGHRPWDLKPQSTMTNASVETSVAANDGQMLTVKYKGGEKKIAVTPQTVVVSYAPGDKAEVKPGTHVFVAATRQPDGSLQTPRITYGKDGLVPPM